MAQEVFARLTLRRPVPLASGIESREVVILRPNAREITAVLNERGKFVSMLSKFVTFCCRAEVGANGTAKLVEFNSLDLDASDASELSNIINAMGDDSDDYVVDDIGDGVVEPIVYNLIYPIKLAAAGKPEEEWETIKQIEFQARKLGELSEYLDAQGLTNEFHAFMRSFGTMLGTNMPMADSIIDSIDYLDYFVIRRKILGKLSLSRGRWKRISISPRSASIGPPVAGITSR